MSRSCPWSASTCWRTSAASGPSRCRCSCWRRTARLAALPGATGLCVRETRNIVTTTTTINAMHAAAAAAAADLRRALHPAGQGPHLLRRGACVEQEEPGRGRGRGGGYEPRLAGQLHVGCLPRRAGSTQLGLAGRIGVWLAAPLACCAGMRSRNRAGVNLPSPALAQMRVRDARTHAHVYACTHPPCMHAPTHRRRRRRRRRLLHRRSSFTP